MPGVFGLALISVMWAYDGFADLTFASGEVKDPQRNLPRAIIIGTLLIIAIYLTANAAYLYVNPIDVMAKSRLIAADTMGALFGQIGVSFVSVIVMISTFGSLMGSMLASPRIFFAMADDKLLFEPIARVHPKWNTPYVAIALACVLGVAMVMTQTFEQLTDTFVLAMWPFYALSVGRDLHAAQVAAEPEPAVQGDRLSGRAGGLHRRGDLPGGERADHRSEVDVDHVRRRAAGAAGVLRLVRVSCVALEHPRLAAVDDDGRAADPAGLRRREKRDRRADFFGLAEPAERQLLLDELRDAFGIGLLPLPPRSAFKQDRARRHRDDADLILRQLLRERLRQADLRGLDRVVGHAAAGLAAEDRRHDHDAPPPCLRMCGTARRDMRIAGNSV